MTEQSEPRRLRRALPAMLRGITEYFAATLSGAADGEPDWSDVEWRVARAVTVLHGVSPLLSRQLNWTGPPGWREFLESQRTHTANRYQRMSALLINIDTRAAQAGIAFVPLKGEALHSMGLYAPGDRPMADLDLLVRPGDLQLMNGLLTKLGYRAVKATADEHVLVPADKPPCTHLAEHADNGITIEVHAAISRTMPVRLVDITAQLWPSAPQAGRNGYPSLATLLGHLLMHVAVNMQMRIVRMLQLHDIALLAPRLSTADWEELLASGNGHAPPWWALPPLRLVQRYYPQSIPEGVIAAAEPGCPALLRFSASRLRLTDVSASNLRRAVFPGLSWAGSLPEAFGCLAKRVQRGTQALTGSAAITNATELEPWITPSHRRRLFDVLRGRPRPETLLIVEAALQGNLSLASI